MGHVYIISCTDNGKPYIGKTTKANLNSYFSHKLWTAEHSVGKLCPLYNAVHKYGRDSFTVKSLVQTDDGDILNQLEIFFIRAYQSNKSHIGYNATAGGDGLNGYVTSEETKKKLSAISKGKPKSEETRRRMQEAAAARTPEYKSSLSALANQKRQEKLSPEKRSALAKIGSDAALAKLGPYIPKPYPKEKTCKTCGQTKPIEEMKRAWSKSKRFPELGRWHYQTMCKICHLEYKRQKTAQSRLP